MDDFSILASPGSVVLEGEFDLTSVDALRRAFEAAHDDEIVVVMTGVTFMDSSGVNELIRPLQRGARVRLQECPPAVRRVIQITGLDAVLVVDDH